MFSVVQIHMELSIRYILYRFCMVRYSMDPILLRVCKGSVCMDLIISIYFQPVHLVN